MLFERGIDQILYTIGFVKFRKQWMKWLCLMLWNWNYLRQKIWLYLQLNFVLVLWEKTIFLLMPPTRVILYVMTFTRKYVISIYCESNYIIFFTFVLYQWSVACYELCILRSGCLMAHSLMKSIKKLNVKSCVISRNVAISASTLCDTENCFSIRDWIDIVINPPR